MIKVFISIVVVLFCTSHFALSADVLPQKISGHQILTDKIVNYETKNLVVIFMSAKCPCSNSHVETVNKLAERFSQFQFLGVHSNSDEDKQMAQKYFAKIGFKFDIIQDEKNKIADVLKAFKTPHVFVFDSQGSVAYQGGVTNSSHAPAADRQYLEEALDDLKNNKPVRTSQGRTLGCVIMREGEKNVF